MLKTIQLKLVMFAEDNRPALWCLLLIMTATILLFPTNLQLQYYSIQSLHVFRATALFLTIFCMWLLILFLLIFSREGDSKIDWEKMTLVVIASLIFVAFWVMILPYGRMDYMVNARLIKLIAQEGTIPITRTDIIYANFPASHLLELSLSQITGLGILPTMNLFLLLNIIITACLLYLVSSQFLKNNKLAAFGAILVILSNSFLLTYTFWPGLISFTILLAFLLIITQDQKIFGRNTQTFIVLLLLMVSATTMYFELSIFFLIILIVLYIIHRIRRISTFSISIVLLFLIILLGWQIYWATSIMGWMTSLATKIVADISAGRQLAWFFFLASSNVGGSTPLWISLVRLFWWILVFGVGTVLGLRNLLNIKKLDKTQMVEAAGLLGVLILTIIAILVSPGGVKFMLYIQYAGFFTVPALLYFGLTLNTKVKWVYMGLLVTSCVFIALPTFIASNNQIDLQAFYPSETAAGAFLENSFGNGPGLTVYNEPDWQWGYYLPDANFVYYFVGSNEIGMTKSEFWVARAQAIASFTSSQVGQTIFVTMEREKVTAEATFGISPMDPNWGLTEQSLQNTNQIFNDGSIQLCEKIGN